MSANLPKTAVLMLACDRPGKLLERARKSVEAQIEDVDYFLTLDVGSVNRSVGDQLAAAKKYGFQVHVGRVEYRGEAQARNHCLAKAQEAGIELAMWLDDDDVYRKRYVAHMKSEWLRLDKPDILVPGQWAREWGLNGVVEQFHSVIPRALDDFDGWAKLFQIGAACGMSMEAFQRFGGFDEQAPGDPWIRTFYGCVLKSARIAVAEIDFENAYIWLQHYKGDGDVHAQIRAINSRTRPGVVRELYEAHVASTCVSAPAESGGVQQQRQPIVVSA